MDTFIAFLNKFFIGQRETYVYNVPLLIAVVVVLLVALGISVYISKKNRLYIKRKKKDKTIHVFRRNEAA